LPIEDALVTAVFGALSALEALCDNAMLYKLTLTFSAVEKVTGQLQTQTNNNNNNNMLAYKAPVCQKTSEAHTP